MTPPLESRRVFLKKSAAATAAIATAEFVVLASDTAKDISGSAKGNSAAPPWYRRALRWGQTNINELDPQRYDITWWRRYWKRTRIQGVIINAGGIVAYYPSKLPLQYRAATLADRDLFDLEACQVAATQPHGGCRRDIGDILGG